MEMILIIVVLVLLFGGGGGYWGRSRGFWWPNAVLRTIEQARRDPPRHVKHAGGSVARVADAIHRVPRPL